MNNNKKAPLLYDLPRDLHTVRLLAYAYALEGAYTYIREESRSAWSSSDEAARGMALGMCMFNERRMHEGKRGTNDLALFRTTFTETFLLAFPHAEQALRQGSYALAPGLSDEERMTLHYQYATRHLTDS